MLSKLITLVFLAIISVAPVSALASNHPTPSASSTSIEKLATEANVQVISIEGQSSQARNIALKLNQKEPPASGWVLVLALFGFVMLSNRLGL